jgi:hypothetical protein
VIYSLQSGRGFNIGPARGPPLREDCGDVQMGEGLEIAPDSDLPAQTAPGYEVDQRINW